MYKRQDFIEKDDSEDENLTEKENLEDHRNKEDAEIDTIEIKVEKRKDAEIDTIEIEADEIRLIEEENFAENIADNETGNKQMFNQQVGQISHKTNTPKLDQSLVMEEPAPMGYLKKEDLEEENFIEKDDSEDENLTEKENRRNKEEKEDAEIDTIEIEVEEKKMPKLIL